MEVVIYGKHQEFSLHLLDDSQRVLSVKYIQSNTEKIVRYCGSLRQAIDDVWKGKENTNYSVEQLSFIREQIQHYQKEISPAGIAAYPNSLCYVINQIAHAFILQFEFPVLKEFIDKGGVFKIIKGEVNHDYFQTAIQMGEWYLDLANDAVYPKNDKIKCCLLSDDACGFSMVTSLSRYVEVKQKYFQCDLYLNTLFPAIAPYFPLLMRKKNGQLSIDEFTLIADLMILSKGEFLSGFQKEIPLDIKEEFENKIAKFPIENPFPTFTKVEKFEMGSFPKTKQDLSAEDLKQMKLAVRYINLLLK